MKRCYLKSSVAEVAGGRRHVGVAYRGCGRWCPPTPTATYLTDPKNGRMSKGPRGAA